MLNTTIILPKVYNGISFGEEENDTEIIFLGKFCESSGTPNVPRGGGVRYGRKGDKYYVAVDSYSYLSKAVDDIMKRHPQYKIKCTVEKNRKKIHGYVYAYESPCQELELGLVVICLESNF